MNKGTFFVSSVLACTEINKCKTVLIDHHISYRPIYRQREREREIDRYIDTYIYYVHC